MNWIGENMQNNKNRICDGDYRTSLKDVTYSSYVFGDSSMQNSNLKLEGTVAHNQTKQQTMECTEVGDTSEPIFINGLQKKILNRNRIPISGRAVDSEICIFEAEKYFGDREEKKKDANLECTTRSSKPGQNSNSKEELQARNSKVLLSNHTLPNSCHLSSSPASAMIFFNQCFRQGVAIPSTSSEATWNSHSGLLSTASRISGNRSPTKAGRKYSGMWAFCCKWACSSRKSVEIEDTLTEIKPNCFATSAPLYRPASSARGSYPNPGNGVFKNSRQESMGKQIDQRSNDGFTFPVKSAKSQEKLMPSLGMLGSPFPGSSICEKTRSFDPDMAMSQLNQPSDLKGRLVFFDLDKSRKNFMSDSNPESHKLRGIRNEDRDEGMESDSSSDLFEIESASYPLRADDFKDDGSNNPSTACQHGFSKYLYFGSKKDVVHSSVKPFCYESQKTAFINQNR